jgi:MFS family permease/SAM-dependent methyltransferase
MALYAATIFVSAFLLFLVQPIMAKQILPWFGGSANVWTTCLVFFQTTLLLGYAYADLIVRRTSARKQVGVHVALLVVSCLVLPIVPGVQWKPVGTESPSLLILALLSATVGLPYFLLSTTSPLVQAWFARSFPGRNPYRLFALSNLASMLALLGYPIALEPWVTTRFQSNGWSLAYIGFALLCAACGWFSLRPSRRHGESVAAETLSAEIDAPPAKARQLLWAALAATGSFLLLAATNHLCQNISSIPLLWVVPLSIYLLTFILCFDGRGWYRPEVFTPVLAAALVVMAWTLADRGLAHKLELQIGVFCVGLFCACMFCHGELARLKPAPRSLTRFYLMVAAGGAFGSALVGLAAPLVLPAYFELAIGLAACAALLAFQARRRHLVFITLALAAVLFTIGAGVWQVYDFYDGTVLATRNFYGVLRVQEYGAAGDASRHRSLVHGTILHGTQYMAPDLSRQATTYYTQTSGVGRALESMHPTTRPLKVGVIGLGTGTIATYGSKGDTYRFYDINPAVIVIANRDFTYLRDSEATIQIALGDARLSLERETPQGFDLLAIDAFSSDSIPVHLLTDEALAVYLKHMRPGGIIAFHVTNRFLDLIPVVKRLADAHHLFSVLIADDGDDGLASRTDWVLLSDREASLQVPQIAEAATPAETRDNLRLWTDDFNNIIQIIK